MDWPTARNWCYNDAGDGNGEYTLPVPNSKEYHDYISNGLSLIYDNPVALGFSDDSGKWINIYTSKDIGY